MKEDKGSGASGSEKKPRTVHIDVYCTGTEPESDATNTTSEDDDITASSPQTVYESGKYRVTHQRTNTNQLPYHLRPSGSSGTSKDAINRSDVNDKESDDDASTAYPSQRSSYSVLNASSSSSVPPSWSTVSVPDSTATSWKDTYSDVGSLMQSRSSCSSLQRRFMQKKDSIDEYPEIIQETTLQPSDSFEYANSDDKLRIKRMEETWGDFNTKKTPHLDAKHALQQQKLKAYLIKKASSKETCSGESDSDCSEKAWTIAKTSKAEEDKGSLSDSTTPARSPSIMAIKQRLSLDPSLRAPFMIVPGIFTDQRKIAKKFGEIVNVYKKPGHHVGPAKNPDCLCDHCRSYFQKFGYRNRARSVGDQPINVRVPRGWENLNTRRYNPLYKESLTKDGVMYTDF